MSEEQFEELRSEYDAPPLDLDDTHPDPMVQFGRWFDEAIAHPLEEPNAMVLSTVSPDGVPSSRAVLMKSYGADGLVFYTNLGSQKSADIAENPWVSLLFLWIPLHRQVRISGTASRVSDEEADAYFDTRPIGARISAIASPQSSVIPDRDWLERRVAEIEAGSAEIRRPSQWGGFRVAPARFEFWQGRPSRLHDRVSYELADGEWVRNRLAP